MIKNLIGMEDIKKKGRPYVEPLSVIISINAECQLLRTSVEGDHIPAEDDGSYAKQGIWDAEDFEENDWDNDGILY